MKMRTCLLAFGLLLATCGGGRAGETPKSFSVPFDTIKTQHMVVDVKINGKGPYRLIFDTGAPDSLVNNRVAKEAGLFGKDFKKPPFAIFGAMGQVKIKSLEAGDLKAEDLSAMVIDHPTVAAISNVVGPIDGIVGFTFFARYKMVIDYQKKVMTFTPNGFQPPDAMKAIQAKLLAPRSEREKPRILAPGALFGFDVGKDKDDQEPGVTVKEVIADGPAAKAGLKAGDRLLTFDGRWTDSVGDCFYAASRVRPGAPISATLRRDGKDMRIQMTGRAGL